MSDRLPDASLDQVFRTARTRNGWTAETITEAQVVVEASSNRLAPEQAMAVNS